MAWKEESMFTQKQKFVTLYESGYFTMTQLCREFGISRTTGYEVLKLYESEGLEALAGRSRRHQSHPDKTPEEIENAILKIKRHPDKKLFGAKKIRQLLIDDWDFDKVPSQTTVHNILEKNGLIKRQRRRDKSKIIPVGNYWDPKRPGEIHSGDFKGHFRMKNGQYCYPLTIADSFSRKVLACEALPNTSAELCRPVFERVFYENGIPEMVHTDNGSPFGSARALRRMTRFSVWLMEIGTTPVYSDPGRPMQNGRHERMHRDLKAVSTRPPEANMQKQQIRFNRFMRIYNEERPHEAIDMKRPNQIHRHSNLEYTGIIKPWDYVDGFKTRMASANGAIRWGKYGWIMISSALCGKMIGMLEVENGLWELYYRHVLLGYFNERTMKVYQVEEFDF